MGRSIRSKAVRHGLNFDNDTFSDDKYVRCSRCGFICNTERDRTAPEGSRAGWGLTYVAVGGWFADDDNGWFTSGWFTGLNDPTVSAGCPQCGTLRYNK